MRLWEITYKRFSDDKTRKAVFATERETENFIAMLRIEKQGYDITVRRVKPSKRSLNFTLNASRPL